MIERRTIIGTAGWSLPRNLREQAQAGASGLERYAALFPGVEINSTFYRPHMAKTFERWAGVTPADFRFSVKAPKTVTHERRLAEAIPLMAIFLEQVRPLGEKLGPVLIQLPPKLAFDAVAARFFGDLREMFAGPAVCEPRHASWFTGEADALLATCEIGRVAADPAIAPAAAEPGGWPQLAYWRLHGSPRMYYSSYDEGRLSRLRARMLDAEATQVWCVFDNTTLGAAATNALQLMDMARGPATG